MKQNFSGYTLAKYFGVISQNNSTTTVKTAVETTSEYGALCNRMANTVEASADADKLTMLLPTRIAVTSLSYVSSANL